MREGWVRRIRSMMHRICIWGRMTLSRHVSRTDSVARVSWIRGVVVVSWVRLRKWRAIGRIG
jgi:hypothetical protein